MIPGYTRIDRSLIAPVVGASGPGRTPADVVLKCVPGGKLCRIVSEPIVVGVIDRCVVVKLRVLPVYVCSRRVSRAQ